MFGDYTSHVETPYLIVFDNILHLRDDKHFIIVKHFVRLDDFRAYLAPFGHSVQRQYVWSPDKWMFDRVWLPALET